MQIARLALFDVNGKSAPGYRYAGFRQGLNSNKGTKCDIEIRAARTFAGGLASAVYEPLGSTPSPLHSLSGGMIALNHPDRSVH
jgi:hypothetical protein